jgi:hypothetical protein
MHSREMYHGPRTYFNYDNYAKQPNNTCGQAVIATLLDQSGKDPYSIERDHFHQQDQRAHFAPDKIVAEVHRDFGPNWLLKNTLTVRSQIKKALTAYEIGYEEVVHKPFRSAATAREKLEAHIRTGQPVIVLIDTHSAKLGGRFTLHWCIVFGYDDEGVSIATWGKNIRVPWDTFMRAWKCWFVTYPYNYYQIHVTL